MPQIKKQTNNPKGRPKGALNKATAEVKKVALDYAPGALQELARLTTEATSEAARVSACKEILDRAYGKAPQALTVDATVTNTDANLLRTLPKDRREAALKALRSALAE